MKVKQVYVTCENLADIFLIIENTLLTMPDTQIFIDYKIYEELKKNGLDYNVFHPNYHKGWHYWHDDYNNFGGEEWLALTKNGVLNKVIARGSFIANTKEYMQLVKFNSPKVKEYVHYLVGFKQLLLILFKPKKQ
jgi:hypothetical protein